MHVIDVIALVMDGMDIVIGFKTVLHVIDVIPKLMEVMDIVLKSKL